MQQRVNEVWLKVNDEVITLKDVDVIETEDSLYVEDTHVLGKDDDGKDIEHKRMICYPNSALIKLVWTENALVDKVKETVISELATDKLEQMLDLYGIEDDDGEPAVDKRDDPDFNPYKKE